VVGIVQSRSPILATVTPPTDLGILSSFVLDRLVRLDASRDRVRAPV